MMNFVNKGFPALIATVTLMTTAWAKDPCPTECKCYEESLVDVGLIYHVICSNRDLVEVPDLRPLSPISLPIYVSLDGNEISDVSSLDFPSGLNIASINLGGNPEIDITNDAFNNYASTLKELSLDAISLKFDKTLKVVSNLEVLEELSVSHNNRRGYVKDGVEDVGVPLFQGPVARSLKRLKMSHCGIKTLSAVTLDSLIALQELDLSNNWFTKVPSAVKHLKELRKLSMFRCNIDILEDYTFLGLSNLEIIELNTNTLHTVENNAFVGLQNSLKKLRLERCHLKEIPSKALKELTVLEYLDLSQNSFSTAPPSSFEGNYCLKTLLISAIGLQFEDQTFSGQKECITQLTIKQMQLKTVPRAAIAVLNKLSSLSLDYNNFTTLPQNAFTGIKAKRISLANNPLRTIEPGAFNGLPPQLDINLRRTKMSDIDFLLGYPEDAIETVNLDFTELVCGCSMKSSLNATWNIYIYGSCQKGEQIMPLSSSRLEGILDLACAEELAAKANQATSMRENKVTHLAKLLANIATVSVMYFSFLPNWYIGDAA